MSLCFNLSSAARRRALVTFFLAIASVLVSQPASAHHAMGGALPTNGWQGLLSGLAHPVLGLDHFAFIVAVGLLAAFPARGIWIPVTFIAASLAGTGIHLMALHLPATELIVSLSVLLFGALLVFRRSGNFLTVLGLAAAAGIFHGFAYGESIVGAEATPLGAYLVGLAAVQLAVAVGVRALGEAALRAPKAGAAWTLRFVGVLVCAVGVAFLSGQLLG